jgi:hypothetical protein
MSGNDAASESGRVGLSWLAAGGSGYVGALFVFCYHWLRLYGVADTPAA